jgi:hypothetical protein
MRSLLLAMGAMALSTSALAADAAPAATKAPSTFDLYYGASAKVAGNSVSDDGYGFGARGQLQAGENFALVGEYMSNRYDDTGTELEQSRIGGAYLWSGSGVVVEWVDASFVEVSAQGWAYHGRLAFEMSPGTQVVGQYGRLELQGQGNVNGPEWSVGLVTAVAPGGSVFADYRVTDIEMGEQGSKFSDLRVGARFSF